MHLSRKLLDFLFLWNKSLGNKGMNTGEKGRKSVECRERLRKRNPQDHSPRKPKSKIKKAESQIIFWPGWHRLLRDGQAMRIFITPNRIKKGLKNIKQWYVEKKYEVIIVVDRTFECTNLGVHQNHLSSYRLLDHCLLHHTHSKTSLPKIYTYL